MTTGKAVLWSAVGIAAVAGIGYGWLKISPNTFPIPGLRPHKPIPGTAGVSLSVGGYATSSSGGPATAVHIADNSQVTATVTVSLSASVQAMAVGLRGWLVQLGASLDPTRILSVGSYTGTVEGHLFASGSQSQEVLTATLQPGASQTMTMATGVLQPTEIAWAVPNAASQFLGVILAAGPASDVSALPDWEGALSTSGTVAYSVSAGALIYP